MSFALASCIVQLRACIVCFNLSFYKMDAVVPNIKTEPEEGVNLESRIIELCEKSGTGIAIDLINVAIPSFSTKEIASSINRLLSQGRIELLKKGKQLLYKLRDPDAVKQLKGFSREEKIVYKLISDAGNKGIWVRNIHFESNIPKGVLNKVLKHLKVNKHVKPVKSVSASKRQYYMLYNLEPDTSLTGGAWYCEQEFESEFVEVLTKQCYAFLQETRAAAEKKGGDPITCRNASYKSSRDVWKYINDLKVSRVELSEENIEDILNTLIADEKVEKKVVGDGSCSTGQQNTVDLYRAITSIVPSSELLRMPCGVCRIYKDCREGGIVSPSTCLYMKEWFDY